MVTVRAMSSLLVATIVGVGGAGCEASGRAETVSGYGRAGVAVEDVRLHWQPVTVPWVLVANLEAEAGTARFGTVEEAEAAAYEKLRKLASRSGANAVIDIERRVERETGKDGLETVVRVTARAVVLE